MVRHWVQRGGRGGTCCVPSKSNSTSAATHRTFTPSRASRSTNLVSAGQAGRARTPSDMHVHADRRLCVYAYGGADKKVCTCTSGKMDKSLCTQTRFEKTNKLGRVRLKFSKLKKISDKQRTSHSLTAYHRVNVKC